VALKHKHMWINKRSTKDHRCSDWTRTLSAYRHTLIGQESYQKVKATGGLAYTDDTISGYTSSRPVARKTKITVKCVPKMKRNKHVHILLPHIVYSEYLLCICY